VIKDKGYEYYELSCFMVEKLNDVIGALGSVSKM